MGISPPCVPNCYCTGSMLIMAKAVEQKNKGRPPGSAFAAPFPMRFTTEQMAAIDAWRRTQDDPPSRTEAVRLILSDWLTGQGLLPHRDNSEGAN